MKDPVRLLMTLDFAKNNIS